MKRLKVMCIFGTRPEAIKMCPLIIELKKEQEIETIVTVTGQHTDMLDNVLQIFNVIPDYNLAIMENEQTLTSITVKVIAKLDQLLSDVKPDIVLVHGDTTTTFAASLSAFYKKIKIGHIEAGLRTYHKYSPFPEEVNRQLTSVIADFHFAPTALTKENLLLENIDEQNIFVVGNTAIDSFAFTINDQYHNQILD